MTRKEEIKQKALSKYPQGTNRYNKFIEGAEWADKTMIDKFMAIFPDFAYKYAFAETKREEKEILNIIRKAMEE